MFYKFDENSQIRILVIPNLKHIWAPAFGLIGSPSAGNPSPTPQIFGRYLPRILGHIGGSVLGV